jgi:hypothetical protein
LNYLFGTTVDSVTAKKEEKVEIKYEERFLVEIRKMDKEFHFDEDEQARILEKKQELLNDLGQSDSEVNDKQMVAIEEDALQFVISKKLERIRSCFVMEYTPLGNVLMTYDIGRMSFKYYSDNTIPYRYLETVGRKFVKQFDCRPIFVDMEEELRLAEEKWNEQQERKKLEDEENERKRAAAIAANNPIETKKPIFAKFKSYNKDAASGKVNSAPPPKNSIPNKKIGGVEENGKLLLKDRANRYTYEGKISNFQIIQKVERKLTNKKYGTTFADFKKMFG